MRVLGIDPGLIITGWGMLEGDLRHPKVIEAGVVRVPENNPLEQRLRELHAGITEIIETYRPEVMAVEALYSHYKHPATAILMGHARGAIFLAAGQLDVPVFTYPANRIKVCIVGSGHASKERVQRMVTSALGLRAIPEPPDVADALAVALTHLDISGRPVPPLDPAKGGTVPHHKRRRLDKQD
jgi:crossover junction endodeoxyribonuclease RuvC